MSDKEMTFLDFIRKVHEERKAWDLVIKGGKGSGWFAPPKGTHSKGKKEKWAPSPFDVPSDSVKKVTIFQGTTKEGGRAWEEYGLTGLPGPLAEEYELYGIEEEEKYRSWLKEQEEFGFDPMIVWVSNSPDYAKRYGRVFRAEVARNQLIYVGGDEFMMPTDADYEPKGWID